MLRMEGPLDAPTRFVGFDSGGEVFLSQGRVLRGIYPGNGALYRQVLRTCEAHDLFRFGIVATRESHANPHPDLSYDLVLEHERVPFVSYPHEWPASMLKTAALFHIDLYTELGPHGLTIKDWHPYNVLFKDTEPVFVDFTSIIPVDNLQDEEYLTPPHVPVPFRHVWDTTSAYFYEMYRRLCVPYLLLPLYLMHYGRHGRARARMFETTLGIPCAITLGEVFPYGGLDRWRYEAKGSLKKLALVQRGPIKHWFLRLLRGEVQCLSVSPRPSGYSNYYAAKDEAFGFEPASDWADKQLVVYEAIKRFRPQTLLDVASNTGWFSVLAAKLGCRVVAFDIDEACIDVLYKRAKQDALSILPLVMDLTKPTPDVFPLEYENEPQRSLIAGDFPVLLSADKRLKCDMVLALAIVHHLALGQGQSFSEIVQTLSAFTNKYLLVEFIARDNKLIVAEPAFFPALDADPLRFGWYTLDNFTRELRRRFRHVETKKSHPASRFIVICER